MSSSSPEAEPPGPQDAPLVLPYADVPAQFGITCEYRSDGVLIRIPQHIPPSARLLLFFALACFPFLAMVLPTMRTMGSSRDLLIVLAISIGGSGLVIIAASVWPRRATRWAKPIEIELNIAWLIVRNLEPGGPLSDRQLPRDQVYEIKYVPHSGHLVIRAHGCEMIDFRPVDSDRAMRWVAETLQAALSRAPTLGDATSASPSG